MDRDMWKEALRRNWILIAVLGVIALFFGYKTATTGGNAEGEVRQTLVARELPEEPLTLPEAVKRRERQTEEQKTRSTIARHLREAREEEDPERSPALINAAANLNFKRLGDYEETIRLFELLLHDYPQWEGRRGVYAKLATCYEHIGDAGKVRQTWRYMMDEFPEGTQENELARRQLGYQPLHFIREEDR